MTIMQSWGEGKYASTNPDKLKNAAETFSAEGILDGTAAMKNTTGCVEKESAHARKHARLHAYPPFPSPPFHPLAFPPLLTRIITRHCFPSFCAQVQEVQVPPGCV